MTAYEVASVLTHSFGSPQPELIEGHAEMLDLALRCVDTSPNATCWEMGSGAGFTVESLGRPHPELHTKQAGILSPDLESTLLAPNHLVLTGVGLGGDFLERDAVMYRLTASVCRSTEAVAAVVGNGANFQSASSFTKLVDDVVVGTGDVPVELAVTTSCEELRSGLSILTTGLDRFGCTEILLDIHEDFPAPLEFLYSLARCATQVDLSTFPEGETVGHGDRSCVWFGRRGCPHDPSADVLYLRDPQLDLAYRSGR